MKKHPSRLKRPRVRRSRMRAAKLSPNDPLLAILEAHPTRRAEQQERAAAAVAARLAEIKFWFERGFVS